jgi:hypothetical protein
MYSFLKYENVGGPENVYGKSTTQPFPPRGPVDGTGGGCELVVFCMVTSMMMTFWVMFWLQHDFGSWLRVSCVLWVFVLAFPCCKIGVIYLSSDVDGLWGAVCSWRYFSAQVLHPLQRLSLESKLIAILPREGSTVWYGPKWASRDPQLRGLPRLSIFDEVGVAGKWWWWPWWSWENYTHHLTLNWRLTRI